MSAVDVTRRLDKLERRLSDVELNASPDTMSNNFIVVNADGSVTLVFNGKIIAQELDLTLALGNVQNVNKVRWLRASDGAEGAYLAANALAGDGAAGSDYSGFLSAIAESVGATRQAQVTTQALSNFDSLSGALLRAFSAPGNPSGSRHKAYAETESDNGGAVFDNVLLDGAGNLSGLRCLADSIVSVATTQVDISLPTIFGTDLMPPHLLIVARHQTTSAADQSMFIRFNGDTAANYRWQGVNGQGAAASGRWDGGAANTVAFLGDTAYAGGGGTASSYGAWLIPNWYKTDKLKGYVGINAELGNSFNVGTFGGIWTTAALTQLSFLLSGGTSFAVDTRFTVYAIGSKVT